MITTAILVIHSVIEAFFGLLFMYHPTLVIPVTPGTSEYTVWRILGISILTQGFASAWFVLHYGLWEKKSTSVLAIFGFYHVALVYLFLLPYNLDIFQYLQKKDFIEYLHLVLAVAFVFAIVISFFVKGSSQKKGDSKKRK